MKGFLIIAMAVAALLYLISALVYLAAFVAINVYDFFRWFLDSRYTPRK